VLVNLQSYKSDVRARVQYLLYGLEDRPRNPDDVLVFGNVGSFVASGETISRKVKAFNYLVCFKEDYETFLSKVGDLHSFVDELLEWLIPYDREDYEVLVVGHRDTDNFHLHITVLNRNLRTGKALYIPRTRSEVNYYQELRKYFSTKYGLELGNKRLVKHYIGDLIGGKQLGRIRELIAEHFAEYVQEGYADSREDIIELLKDIGFEIVDIWHSGVRVRKDGEELTLIGGLFDEREFKELRAELQQGERERVRTVPNLSTKEFRELADSLRELSQRRRKSVRKRVLRELGQAERSRRKKDRNRYWRVIDGGAEKEQAVETAFSSIPSLSCFSVGSNGRRDRSSIQQNREGGFSPALSEKAGGSTLTANKRVQWRKVVMQKLLALHQQSAEVGESGRESVLHTPEPPTDTATTKEMIMAERRLPFTSEEIDKAKEIDPLTLIRYYGLDYQRVGEQIRVKAPWREEREPSVFIRVNPATGHLIWKDFGGDQDGGSAIDFVMKASNLSFVEAVALLLELQGEPVLPEHPEQRLPSSFSRKSLPKGYTHMVLKVKDKVDHTALTSLLRRKGLDPVKLPPWVKELHWEVEREDGYRGRFFGLAVQTTGGSWIVRTALDKRPKTVVQEKGVHHSFAYCPAKQGKRGKALVVVEGITDYIAFWQYLQRFENKDDFDIVILGGTGTVQDFIESGIWLDYKELFLGLDLDEAGEKAREKIVSALRELRYKGFISSLGRSLSNYGKDINEIVRESDLRFEVVYNPNETFLRQENRKDRERGRSPGL